MCLEVERLIRTAGFEPVKVGGIEQSGRLEVGGDLHDLVVGPAEARSLNHCPIHDMLTVLHVSDLLTLI
jgi:hypothetical protein